MKHLKMRLIAFCLLLSFSIMNPVQVQPTTQNPLSPQKTITAQAKAKKKVVKKRATKKTTAKKKTAKKTTAKNNFTKSVTVYVTPTGACYHKYACGRGSYSKSTLNSAKSRGLRPCKKCY